MQTYTALESATYDVMLRRNATDLYRAACHKKNVPYREFNAWIKEKRNDKAISYLIAAALKEAEKERKALLTN